MIRTLLLIIFLICYFLVSSQEKGITGDEIGYVYRDEWDAGVFIHSNGFGASFYLARWTSYRTRNSFELQYTHFKHPEETKRKNIYQTDNAKSFIYGKLFYVNSLQIGIDRCITFNEKPYWGGIDVRWFWSGGGQIFWLVPVYVEILHKSTTSSFSYITVERYDPEKHTLEDIYSRDSFWTGFSKSKIYPGAYVKMGLSFDFSHTTNRARLLETGMMLNFSPIPIKIMAHSPSQNIFLNAYLKLLMGKKYLFQRYVNQ
ncbi:MAG: hypothetical protein N2Z72_04590 [Bacteroidales bacterium]|nr:hypothetical protein [Bacteroidales bacterium]